MFSMWIHKCIMYYNSTIALKKLNVNFLIVIQLCSLEAHIMFTSTV